MLRLGWLLPILIQQHVVVLYPNTGATAASVSLPESVSAESISKFVCVVVVISDISSMTQSVDDHFWKVPSSSNSAASGCLVSESSGVSGDSFVAGISFSRINIKIRLRRRLRYQ